MVRDILQSQKVKGQGHQAALLSTALTRKAAAVWERIRRGKVLLRCVCILCHHAHSLLLDIFSQLPHVLQYKPMFASNV